MSRSENTSPSVTPNPSRRPSLLISRDGDADRDKLLEGDGDVGTEDSLRSTESKLRRQIMDLDSFSTEAARTLNDTCDAMQEKMAALQDIVIALKQLADSSRDIHDGFDQVSHDLERDITQQLDAMGQVGGQRDTIQALQSRIQRGRQRIASLSARVEVVRKRVEGWEEADRAWQQTTRKRLTMVWMALTVLAVVVLGILVVVDYNRDGAEGIRHPVTATTTPGGYLQHDGANATGEYRAVERLATGRDGAEAEPETGTEDEAENKANAYSKSKPAWKTPADDEAVPRVFDEV